MADKPTNEEQRERIDFAKDKLRFAFYRSEIMRKIRKEFVGVSPAAADRLITRAQRELLDEYRANGMESWQIISVEVYRTLLHDPLSTVADKIRAMTRIDRVLGLEKPRQSEMKIYGDGLDNLNEEQLRERAAEMGLVPDTEPDLVPAT